MRNEERAGKTRSFSFTENLTKKIPFIRKNSEGFFVGVIWCNLP